MTDEQPADRCRVLHLTLSLSATNSQYNEHCLPMAKRRAISICTFFEPQLSAIPEIRVFPGNGTVLGFFRALRAALGADPYDVIHAHSPHTGVLLLLALFAWGLSGRLRPLTAYTVHDSFPNYKPRNKLLLFPVLAFFREIIFCSHAGYESIPPILKRLGGSRIHVVQNGVDLDRIDRALSRTVPSRSETEFTIVSIGRLEAIKDPLLLLSAFRRSADDDSRLILIGKGSLAEAVEERIEAWSMTDEVTLTGLIERDEVYEIISSSDLYISVSRGEGLPVAVMEAMACGRPVILSDIPPHREVVGGVDFIPLIPPGDAMGFAKEIGRYRAMRPEERDEIGGKCRTLVADRFSLPSMHAGYDAAYARIGACPSGSGAG